MNSTEVAGTCGRTGRDFMSPKLLGNADRYGDRLDYLWAAHNGGKAHARPLTRTNTADRHVIFNIELSVESRPMICCRICRPARQMRHLPHPSRHIEDRRRRIALGTECAIPAAPCVVVANVVFAGEGTFKVPGTLMNRGTLRAATLSVVHAGSHFSLAFDYGTKRSTNTNSKRTKVTKFFITKLGG